MCVLFRIDGFVNACLCEALIWSNKPIKYDFFMFTCMFSLVYDQ